MEVTENSIIGEIVAKDFRLAQIFKNNKIDFCCQGNRSISDACEKDNLIPENLLKEIAAIQNSTADTNINFQSWPLDLLADYVEKKHHRYVERQTPILKQYLQKITTVHGKHHPELEKITELFIASTGELTMHMKKEELMLFPLIRKMVKAQERGEKIDPATFGSVLAPIRKMMEEHETEGDRFREIASLSNDYNSPADGCNTYKVAFGLLKEFEEDLHLHIHVENNILFPKSMELENALSN